MSWVPRHCTSIRGQTVDTDSWITHNNTHKPELRMRTHRRIAYNPVRGIDRESKRAKHSPYSPTAKEQSISMPYLHARRPAPPHTHAQASMMARHGYTIEHSVATRLTDDTNESEIVGFVP